MKFIRNTEDAELEEAKKLIGKWVKNGRGDMAIKVANVYKNHRGEILYESKGYSVTLEHWEPFPIPVWRCCETDRPKKDGRYAIRHKHHHSCYNSAVFHYDSWDVVDLYAFEWLDEGGGGE